MKKNKFKCFIAFAVLTTMLGTTSHSAFADTSITSAAIFINDGQYVADQSISTTVSGGRVTNTTASGVSITSDTEDLNGLYVKGSASNYTLQNSKINLTGNGSNDFDGHGSASMVNDGGTLTLKNVHINTNGCIRSAVTATDNSTLKVYNSTLVTNGGTLPSDYVTKIGPGMMEPPAGLGITGTCRTCLTMDNSKSYFYNSTIVADGWGALSTDSANGYVYLEANNCKIKNITGGYGAYADNGCHDVFNDCKFDSAAMALIMAGVSDATYKNTSANCGTYFAMLHNVMGSDTEKATLNITGSNIKTTDAAILVKSDNADITIDSSKISSKSGTIIKSIINSDPNRTLVNGDTVYGIHANLKNMKLKGDIIHEDTERTMTVNLIGTNLKGEISNASISIDKNSRWTATADSKATLVSVSDVSKIDAPTGVTITATAGTDCNLKGTYNLKSGGILNIAQ